MIPARHYGSVSAIDGLSGKTRRLRLVAGFVVAALVVVGCDSSPTPRPSVSVVPSAVGLATESFETAALDWQPCPVDDQNLECATLVVPMDWSELGRVPGRESADSKGPGGVEDADGAGDPGGVGDADGNGSPDATGAKDGVDAPGAPARGATVSLALKRRPANNQGEKLGSLLVNPGGPGGSGASLVESVEVSFGDRVLEHYDVVGWDPRGVRESTSVECRSDAERDAARQISFDPSTDEGFDAFEAALDDYAKACSDNSGELLGYVDTVSSAMDMEAIRMTLQTEQADYLGYSYGTLLGSTYAEIYPERVGRFVLDGALDPSASYEQLGQAQATGFESALRAYVTDCMKANTCPLKGSIDNGIQQIRDLFVGLKTNLLPTNDAARPLTEDLAISAVVLTLYDDKNMWPHLSAGLTKALRDKDGSYLLFLADVGAERAEDGSYETNSDQAFIAINCLDYPMLEGRAAMRADEAELISRSPTFGAAIAYGGQNCAAWPYPSVRTPAKVTARGSEPILVIGTTNDPATPYAFSEALASQLENATLLTFEGEGHTAYGKKRSNACINDAVDNFLVSGVMPEANTRC